MARKQYVRTTQVKEMKPTHGMLILKVLTKKRMVGGIEVTSDNKIEPDAEVVAVGDDSWQGWKLVRVIFGWLGISPEINFKVGDKVLIPKMGATKFSNNGQDYIYAHYQDVKIKL